MDGYAGKTVYAALLSGLVLVAAAPYLARLTRSVPDRADAAWWRGRPASRRRVGVTTLVAAASGALAGAAAGWTAALPAFTVLALAGAPLAIIDIELHRLPDRLVLVAFGAGGALLTLAAAIEDRWAALGRAGAAGGIVLAAGTVLTLAAPFGFGDTKLAAVLAGYLGWFGWIWVAYGLAAGFVLATVATLALLALRRATLKSAIPLGPALLAGALVVAALRGR